MSETFADPVFTEHRRLLFSVAYRMTGSVADAEDIVQDAWLRWSATDPETVRAPVPYLVKTVTNLALNEMTTRTGAAGDVRRAVAAGAAAARRRR